MADSVGERKRYFYYHGQLVAVGIAFAITSLAIFILGVIAGRHVGQAKLAENAASVTRIPVSPPPPPTDDMSEAEAGAHDQDAAAESPPEIPPNSEKLTQKNRQRLAKAESAQTPAVVARPQGPSEISATKAETAPAVSEETRQTKSKATKESAALVWAVQVKSSPERKFADNWVNRLKAKGYDAFVVEGEVNGKTWYRVRVGRFAARQEAEALRDTLEAKDGLKGSFVTRTKTAEADSSAAAAEPR